MVTDVMQAVSHWAQRPEVDKRRIAAFGYSMRSFLLSVTCAAETRLKACVLAGRGNRKGPNGYCDNSKPMWQGYAYRSLSFLGDRRAAMYSLHASRAPTLVYNRTEDTTVAIPTFGESYFRELRDRFAGCGRRRGVFNAMFHPAQRPYFVTKPVALWLERHLEVPNWTAAEIEGMPLRTLASGRGRTRRWMDLLYATEHREGGTPALGAGVRGISRADLRVLGDSEWEARRDLLVHESWRRKR